MNKKLMLTVMGLIVSLRLLVGCSVDLDGCGARTCAPYAETR